MNAGDVGTGTAWRLLAVVVLVLINSLINGLIDSRFAAAEFGPVAVRRSRIDPLVAEGDRGARRVQRALAHLDRYTSGTQLGIALASLAVGWIGEPALAALVGRGLGALGIGGAVAAPSPATESAVAVTIALDASDSALLSGVLDFRGKRARDVMCPRHDVAAISVDATEADVRAMVPREQYSRYPVYRGTLDDLHRSNSQMAVVLDEYAGTAGVLTIEDLVEEIVREIFDECDAGAGLTVGEDGALQLPGALSLIDARSNHDLHVPEDDWATLGGYVFAAVGRVPAVGDRAQFPNGEFEVLVMDGRRVSTVGVHRRRPAPADAASSTAADATDAGDLAGDVAPALRETPAAGARPPSVERRLPLPLRADALPPNVERRLPLPLRADALPPNVERRMPLRPVRVHGAVDHPPTTPTRRVVPAGSTSRP